MKTFSRLATLSLLGILPINAFAHPGHADNLSHVMPYVVAFIALAYWSVRTYRTH